MAVSGSALVDISNGRALLHGSDINNTCDIRGLSLRLSSDITFDTSSDYLRFEAQLCMVSTPRQSRARYK